MHYDVLVIGGGIVGLATALNLKKAKPNLRLLLVEKENSLAAHQTGHNSGVIHSGLYYKPGSLKAKNCIEGYHMLIDFCNENNIKYELCGKIVVATSEDQLASLDTLYERGIQNGLEGLEKLNKEQLQAIEPHVAGIAGIKVPQTGIINYTTVSEKYAENITKLGGEIRLGEKVSSISEINGVSTVVTTKGSYNTTLVINCAGLYSDKVAQFTEKEQVKVRIIPFRGEYYEIKPEKQYLVKHLIYPVPDPNFPFLGVHFTRMVDGGVEAGPNAVLAFRREGYKKLSVDFSEFGETLAWPGFRKVAAKSLQALIPEIQKDDLVPGGAGVRAQACDYDGGLLDDFSILENKQAINVLNAPSPAATSSLSIGKTVAEMALKRLN
jgi:(S)-2-hydroxyglutarate dehydrogenase